MSILWRGCSFSTEWPRFSLVLVKFPVYTWHAPSGIGLAFAHGHDPLLGEVSLHPRQRLRLK